MTNGGQGMIVSQNLVKRGTCEDEGVCVHVTPLFFSFAERDD